MRVVAGLLCFFLCMTVVAEDVGFSLTEKDQQSVGLTIYNDFAVVRDVRQTVLPRGRINVEFQHVPQQIDPASVRVSTLEGAGFDILEQSYQYDLLTKQSVLERYIGSKLKYSRNVLQGTTYEKVLREGILLSIDPEIVKFGDEIEISPEGVISLPYVPAGLRTIPTLVWKADNNTTGRQLIETLYITNGVSWDVDYLLQLVPDETKFDLTAWANVSNHSGIGYKKAALMLVAGDVNRAMQKGQMQDMAAARGVQMFESAPMPTRQPFSDYHVYDVPDSVNITQNETKQLRLMSAEGVRLSKRYVSTFGVATHQMPQPMESHFDIVFEFDNSATNQLGHPLPRGRIRAFKDTEAGASQMLGEAMIDHVASGETVEFPVGQAFDLIAERTQRNWRRLGERAVEISYDVSVRNRKEDKVTLVLHEKLYGDWQVLSQTESGTKTDSATLEFIVELPGGAERTVSYTVQVNF